MRRRLPLTAEQSLARIKAGRLERAALKQLRVHEREGTIPTDGHFLFYELEQLGIVAKEEKQPKPGKRTARQDRQDLTDALTHLCEEGIIPWDGIEDGRRHYISWANAPSVAEFVTGMARAPGSIQYSGSSNIDRRGLRVQLLEQLSLPFRDPSVQKSLPVPATSHPQHDLVAPARHPFRRRHRIAERPHLEHPWAVT